MRAISSWKRDPQTNSQWPCERSAAERTPLTGFKASRAGKEQSSARFLRAGPDNRQMLNLLPRPS